MDEESVARIGPHDQLVVYEFDPLDSVPNEASLSLAINCRWVYTRSLSPWGAPTASTSCAGCSPPCAPMVLEAWLTGARGQQMIGAYRLDGQQLFTPNAVSR